ncbi:MAG: 30S ribosomal protein S16 [Alphaproteobacteria bacterium]|nr:30S ribosomal protein S16 [Alphaproteobacteria bacterium]
MSVRIRLARGGSKKRPFHKIVVADKRAPRDGRFIEELGYYNPLVAHDHPEHLKVNVERAQEWIAKGAEVTDRLQRLFGAVGIMEARVVPTNEQQPKKSALKAKALERLKEQEEKEAARREAEEAAKREAEEASRAAEEAAKAEAEAAPAEEAQA